MLSKLSIAASAVACSVLLSKNGYVWAAQPIPKFELCQVQVIFRHGARTPLYDAPYLPAVSYDQGLMNHASETQVNYKLVSLQGDNIPRSRLDESYLARGFLKGGCVRGQLTSIGAEQCYELGKNLRKRYIEEQRFLSSEPANLRQELYVQSTHVVRTIFSARCVLAGLLNEYGVEPVSIHITSAEKEIMYPNYYMCAMLKKLGSREPDKVHGVKEIKRKIGKKLELPDDVDVNLIALKDNFFAEEAHGKPSLRSKLDLETEKLLDQGAMKIMNSAFVGASEVRHQMLKLAVGPFVEILVSNMENFTEAPKNSTAKFHLYSGHDTTLIPLLSAIGIDCEAWPPYASNVIVELYRNTDIIDNEEKYYVKVLFNGEEQLIAKQSSAFCPLSKFLNLTESVRLPYEKYVTMCQLGEENSSSRSRSESG